jgi:hypothetical protein
MTITHDFDDNELLRKQVADRDKTIAELLIKIENKDAEIARLQMQSVINGVKW